MPAPRVLVSASASRSGLAAARRVGAALDKLGIPFAAAPATREELDACEVLVALYDRRAGSTGTLNQELGYALARNVPIVLASDAAAPALGILAGAPAHGWPRTPAAAKALVHAVRRALPATPRARVRSLALSSPAHWSRALREEAGAELAALGWEPVPMALTRQGSSRVFVGPTTPDEPVWRKKVDGRWTYLRPRVAPFDPVDLARVRDRFAAQVFEWWVLPDGRSDAWMKRVYGGETRPLTGRTKFAGALDPPRSPQASREGALISRRFVTERVDRTGDLAGELRALESWLAARRPKRAARPAPPAPREAPPARSSPRRPSMLA